MPYSSAGTSTIIVGTTALSSGTTTRVLFDNAGVIAESAFFTFDPAGPTLTTTGTLAVGAALVGSYQFQVKAATNERLSIGPAVNMATAVAITGANDANSANIPGEFRFNPMAIYGGASVNQQEVLFGGASDTNAVVILDNKANAKSILVCKDNGTAVFSVLDGGVAQAAQGVSFTGGTEAAGAIVKDPTFGLDIRGIAGTTADFCISESAGSVLLMNPVGTNDLALGAPTGTTGPRLITGQPSVGADKAGGNLVLGGGISTGAGSPAGIDFQTGTVAGSSSTPQTLATRMSLNGITNVFGAFKGADVASATAIVPTGNLFHVTGTTTITSVTATDVPAGAVITIIFDGILTFTDGSNLKLAGNFTTSADDTITLAYDGTNWYEIARSVN